MSTHLITGFAGREHITAADQGSFNAAIMGGGEFVLERGEQLRCQVISNNKVRIYDGDILMQGRHIIIDRNTYEETTHDNGTQGYLRNDLIVLTYEKNPTTGIESAKIEVIKGTPAESAPTMPEYVVGDILDGGALKNQMPLYRIPFDGLSIGTPISLFKTVPTLEEMKQEVDTKVDEKIAEMEESINEKISDAGKPLCSNYDDMLLIENYGEYSADAKTVGEELETLKTIVNGDETWELLATTTSSTANTFAVDLTPYKKIAIVLSHTMYQARKANPVCVSKELFKTCTDKNNFLSSNAGSASAVTWYVSETEIGLYVSTNSMKADFYGVR